MPSLLAMTTSAFDPASRVRLIQLIPGLEKAGWHVDHRPNAPDRLWSSSLSGRWVRAAHHRMSRLQMKWNRWKDVSDARRYDAVFVNRDLAGGGTLFERRLLSRNSRVVFDFDDAIFIGRNEPSVAWMCAHAAWVTPGNDYLAEYARQYTSRVTVIPTMIDTDRYRVVPARPAKAPVRVGWSGSDQSIAAALFPFLPMLEAMQEELGFEFIISTNTRPTLPVSRLRFTFVPWKAEEEGELGRHMDIGLMPLVDDAFQRGKCGLKLLQYMAAGIPTVASPVGVNASITISGETGFLAKTEQEWAAALGALVRSAELRTALGNAGRLRCIGHYSVSRWLPDLIQILERVAGCQFRGRPDQVLAKHETGQTAPVHFLMDDPNVNRDAAGIEAEIWRPPDAATVSGMPLSTGLTVVICTYARPQSLMRCVESLKVQTRKADELLVVDASRDAATERALFSDPALNDAGARVGYLRVSDRHRGLTRQRNLALGRVSRDLVAFFDDDIVLRPSCLEEMEAVHRRGGESVVGVGAVIEDQMQSPNALWRLRRALGIVSSLQPGRYCRSGMSVPWSFLRQSEGVAEGDWLPGGAAMWKTAAARDVGFNEAFAGYAQGEDLDFCLRVAPRGRLQMACRARLQHLHEEGGRPDQFKLGYMAVYNRFEIHRRGLPHREPRDVAWFAYAWTLDSLLLLRNVLFPSRIAATFRQLGGRARAAWDLVWKR